MWIIEQPVDRELLVWAETFVKELNRIGYNTVLVDFSLDQKDELIDYVKTLKADFFVIFSDRSSLLEEFDGNNILNLIRSNKFLFVNFDNTIHQLNRCVPIFKSVYSNSYHLSFNKDYAIELNRYGFENISFIENGKELSNMGQTIREFFDDFSIATEVVNTNPSSTSLLHEPRCVVVVPIYKNDLSQDEWNALIHNRKVLSAYDVIIVAPQGVDLSRIMERVTVTDIFYFDESYFQSPQTYNKLLISQRFWESFSAYDYMLIAQLDTVVFRDELLQWAKQGYDYIGAPWLQGFGDTGVITEDIISQVLHSSREDSEKIIRYLYDNGIINKFRILQPHYREIDIEQLSQPIGGITSVELAAAIDTIAHYYFTFVGVGNGGLSLRNIKKSLSLFSSKKIIREITLTSKEMMEYPLMKRELGIIKELGDVIIKINRTVMSSIKSIAQSYPKIQRIISNLPEYSAENHLIFLDRLSEIVALGIDEINEIIRNFKEDMISIYLAKMSIPEDFFWGEIAPHFIDDYCVPAPKVALKFSFECNPAYLYKYNNRELPFGCHAWQLPHHRLFWNSIMEQQFSNISQSNHHQ